MKLIIPVSELDYLFKSKPTISKEDLLKKSKELGFIYTEGDEDRHLTLFLSLYNLFRKKEYGVKAKTLKVNSPLRGLVQSVCDEAIVFSKYFAMETRPGFIKFLELATEKGWLTLNKLSKNKHKILDEYELEKALLEDPHPELTNQLFQIYTSETLNRFGVSKDFSIPTEYLHFVRATAIVKKYKIAPADFINWFFECWAWIDGPVWPNKLTHRITEEYIDNLVKDPSVNRTAFKKVTIRKGSDRWE